MISCEVQCVSRRLTNVVGNGSLVTSCNFGHVVHLVLSLFFTVGRVLLQQFSKKTLSCWSINAESELALTIHGN